MKNNHSLTFAAIFFCAAMILTPQAFSASAKLNAAEVLNNNKTQDWDLISTDRVQLLHSSDHRHWKNVLPSRFRADAAADKDWKSAYGFYSRSANDALMLIRSASNPHPTNFVEFDIFRTWDGGKHWKSSHLKSATGFGDICIDFADKRNGGMVIDSDMASGNVEKAVYQTYDGGIHWTLSLFTRHSSNGLPGRGDTAGFTARTSRDFWYALNNHDETDGYMLYHSSNAGKTWHEADLIPPHIPKSIHFKFFESHSPLFHGPHRLLGEFILDEFGEDLTQRAQVVYHTTDGGAHWKPEKTHLTRVSKKHSEAVGE
jgi:hypothetical protein